ncbi:MAG: hypothetical protein P8M25_21115 [Paracoccaceae bacterium]|nr:hypothetical protein [Paracoccaceae bacterium]
MPPAANLKVAIDYTIRSAKGKVLMRTLLISNNDANWEWMQGTTYRTALRGVDVVPTYGIARKSSYHSVIGVGQAMAGDNLPGRVNTYSYRRYERSLGTLGTSP